MWFLMLMRTMVELKSSNEHSSNQIFCCYTCLACILFIIRDGSSYAYSGLNPIMEKSNREHKFYMVRKCCIVGCDSNKERKRYTNIFSFPKNPAYLLLWRNAINAKDYVPNENSGLCIRHFHSHDIIQKRTRFTHKIIYRLRQGACPIGMHSACVKSSTELNSKHKTSNKGCEPSVSMLRSSYNRPAATKCSEKWRELYKVPFNAERNEQPSPQSELINSSRTGKSLVCKGSTKITNQSSNYAPELHRIPKKGIIQIRDNSTELSNPTISKKINIVKYVCPKKKFIRETQNLRKDTVNNGCEKDGKRMSAIKSINSWRKCLNITPSPTNLNSINTLSRNISERSNNSESTTEIQDICHEKNWDKNNNCQKDVKRLSAIKSINSWRECLNISPSKSNFNSKNNLKLNGVTFRDNTNSAKSENNQDIICPKKKFMRKYSFEDDSNNNSNQKDRKRLSATKSIHLWRESLGISTGSSRNSECQMNGSARNSESQITILNGSNSRTSEGNSSQTSAKIEKRTADTNSGSPRTKRQCAVNSIIGWRKSLNLQ